MEPKTASSHGEISQNSRREVAAATHTEVTSEFDEYGKPAGTEVTTEIKIEPGLRQWKDETIQSLSEEGVRTPSEVEVISPNERGTYQSSQTLLLLTDSCHSLPLYTGRTI
jgi:hypothetical protein